MLLSVLFFALMITVFGRLALLAVRMTWGLAKVVFSIILLPLGIIAAFFSGLVWVAFIALAIVGFAALVSAII